VSGLVWSGLVWSGLVWSGLVWSGLVWSGLVSVYTLFVVCLAVFGLWLVSNRSGFCWVWSLFGLLSVWYGLCLVWSLLYLAFSWPGLFWVRSGYLVSLFGLVSVWSCICFVWSGLFWSISVENKLTKSILYHKLIGVDKCFCWPKRVFTFLHDPFGEGMCCLKQTAPLSLFSTYLF
jgi:hypothetical protein